MSRKVKDKKNYKMYNQTLFEVQNIVQMKWVKNRQFCYIKWKGYDEKFNTWEPKDHITFCYNYVAPSDKDDDPDYQEKPQACNPTPHHYQTRTKKKITPEHVEKAPESEEKEDHTQLEEQSGAPLINFSPFPLEKSIKEGNKEFLEIRKKGDTQHRLSSKQELVHRVYQLYLDKATQTRKGKVETLDGRLIYMSEQVLKARFPEKVIDYYEQQLKSRSIRYD